MTEDKIIFYELEKVRFIIRDATGLDISYAYEDLVFAEYGVFMLQFDPADERNLLCWFNRESDLPSRRKMLKSLALSAGLNTMKIEYKGTFEMNQQDGKGEIFLKFDNL